MATQQRDDVRTPDRPLSDAIVALAETPEHVSGVDERLASIARLAAQRVAAADYASVTALRDDEYTIVAATSDIAVAVEQAQSADGDGPCLRALRTGEPVGVPSTAATMNWPNFHAVAPGLGLHASVSIPLHMGRGVPVAVLNLYGRDRAAMAPLIVGVAELYAARKELELGIARPAVTDPGAEELLDGYAQALAVRATIQLAVTILAGQADGTPDDAYALLCLRAAEAGASLSAAAAKVIQDEL